MVRFVDDCRIYSNIAVFCNYDMDQIASFDSGLREYRGNIIWEVKQVGSSPPNIFINTFISENGTHVFHRLSPSSLGDVLLPFKTWVLYLL